MWGCKLTSTLDTPPTMKLNEQKCKHATREKDGSKIFDGKGLYLELHRNGSKYWRYKYRIAGKERLYCIGVYPEIGLSEARELHREAHKLVANGIDPTQTKRQEKTEQQSKGNNTFESLAREWHTHKQSEWTEKYAITIMGRLESDIFPQIGFYPISDLTVPVLLTMLRQIESRGVYETTRRAKQYCSQILRYAVATGRAERDLTVDLAGALKTRKTKHHASIDGRELPSLLHALERNEARMYKPTRLAVELMLHTFVRTSELINMRWEEIDWQAREWIIPAERMKMGKAHIVPLSDQALNILRALQTYNGHRQWVFTSHVKPMQPMSNNTILAALYRMGYKGKMTGHGFRALAMTLLQEKLGYPFEVADAQLAHAKKNSLGEAYDRAQFIEQRRKMIQDWAGYLERVAKGGMVITGKFGEAA